MGDYWGLLYLALPLLLLYLVFSRMRRQQRQMATVQAAVEPGLNVMTTSGVYGTVVSTQDDGTVVLAIAPGVHTRWARAAIAEVFDDAAEVSGEAAEVSDHAVEVSDEQHTVDVRTNDVPTRTDHDRDDRTLT